MSMQRDLLRARRRESDTSSRPPSGPLARPSSNSHTFLQNNINNINRNTPRGEAVHVAVRVRPPLQSEATQEVIVAMDPSRNTVYIKDKIEGKQMFSVDMSLWSSLGKALDGSAPISQAALYEQVGRPLLHHALDGFNSTLMAYGQTGSGKTYTMMGEVKLNLNDNDNDDVLEETEEGIIPRLCKEMFQQIQNRSFTAPSGGSISWEVHVSFVEVYCEKVSDLLNHSNPVSLRDEIINNETYFTLSGARRIQVLNTSDILQTLKIGNKCRKTAATSMNERSSRSHAIFILELTEILSFINPEGDLVSAPSKNLYIRLVDLAGSERIGETGASGQVFKEGVEINLSLFTLGMVIESLTDPKRRNIKPPYRESTLTKILKDAFGGNSKTTMICTIAPTEIHRSQTIQTLHYGSKARHVLNKPHVEEDPSATALRKANEELLNLRQQLSEVKHGSKQHQDLFQQLKIVNENLRQEQELSRRRKASLERREEELEEQYRKMEQQRKFYDSKLQEMEAEVERSKIKHKEREKELQKVQQINEAATEERMKELEAQREAVKNHFKRKGEKLLRKQQDTHSRMKDLEKNFKLRVEELLRAQKDLENALKEKENLAIQREEKLKEIQIQTKEESHQLKERIKLQEEEWNGKQKALKQQIREREDELQMKLNDALKKLKNLEEKSSKREEELKHNLFETQNLAHELQERINLKELETERLLIEEKRELQRRERDLNEQIQKTEWNRKIQEGEIKSERDKLEIMKREFETTSANVLGKERNMEANLAFREEAFKKREEQLKQRELDTNKRFEGFLQEKQEWERRHREKVVEVDNRHEEGLSDIRKREIIIQHRENELKQMTQELEKRITVNDMELKRKEVELTTKSSEMELLASRERRATQRIQEELQRALDRVNLESKQRDERMNRSEEDSMRRYNQLEEALNKKEELIKQKMAEIAAQEQEIEERRKEDLKAREESERAMTDIIAEVQCRSEAATMLEADLRARLNSVDGDAENLAACLRLGEKALLRRELWSLESAETRERNIFTKEEEGEILLIKQQIQQDKKEIELKQCSEVLERAQQRFHMIKMIPSHWVQIMLISLEKRYRLIIETSYNHEWDLIKEFERTKRRLSENKGMYKVMNGVCATTSSVANITTLAKEVDLKLREEGLIEEEKRLIRRITEFEELEDQRKEEFNKKDEKIKIYLLELEVMDREKMASHRRAEEEITASLAILEKRERALADCFGQVQQSIIKRRSVEDADKITNQEASEREYIERTFHIEDELRLCRNARNGDYISAEELLRLKESALLAEERRLRDRIAQAQADEARRQERIKEEEQQIRLYLLALEEEDIRRVQQSQAGAVALQQAHSHQAQVRAREAALREEQAMLRRRLQERSEAIDRRRQEASTIAEDNERTLLSQEADLNALLAKNSEIEKEIEKRDVELQHQRGHYIDLRKLLEDREMLLRREHEHRMNGKESATQLTDDLLDVNEILKDQLKVWIQKYQVLKADEKVECEKCLWQNHRDATICKCCGNAQLV